MLQPRSNRKDCFKGQFIRNASQTEAICHNLALRGIIKQFIALFSSIKLEVSSCFAVQVQPQVVRSCVAGTWDGGRGELRKGKGK